MKRRSRTKDKAFREMKHFLALPAVCYLALTSCSSIRWASLDEDDLADHRQRNYQKRGFDRGDSTERSFFDAMDDKARRENAIDPMRSTTSQSYWDRFRTE